MDVKKTQVSSGISWQEQPKFTSAKKTIKEDSSNGDSDKLLVASLAALATITAIGVCYHNRSKIMSFFRKGEKPNPTGGSSGVTPPSSPEIKPPSGSGSVVEVASSAKSQYDDVIIEGVSEVSPKGSVKTGIKVEGPNYDDVILEEGAKIEQKTGYQRPPRKVCYRNGIAIDPVKIRRFTGEVEETSSQGHRLITTYKDGLIEKRKFIPAKGNIKEVTKNYSYNEPFKEIVTKSVAKNGEVTYKYYADFLDKPRLPREFRGFMDLKFGETLGAPNKIHKNGNKTVYRYSDGYTIEQIDKGDDKQIKLLNDGVEVLRRNIFESGDASVVIEKNGSRYSVAKDSKGNFKWSNMMNESSNGETMIFARKANGSGAIVKRNSAGEIIQKDTLSLEKQLQSPASNIDKYDFTPPIDKNIL